MNKLRIFHSEETAKPKALVRGWYFGDPEQPQRARGPWVAHVDALLATTDSNVIIEPCAEAQR